MKKTIFLVKNNDVLKSLRTFLKQLLESQFINAVLVPKMLPSGDGYVQSLIKKPAMLADTNPIAPTMAVQSAQILSELTSSGIASRIGVVLKPCELRAVIELAKFLQVNLDNIVTIGVDCPGTYEVKEYAELNEQERIIATQNLINDISKGETSANDTIAIREACRICEYPVPLNADITLGLLGSNPSKEIAVFVSETLEKELAEKLSLDLKEDGNSDRENAIKATIGKRKEARDRLLSEMNEKVNGLDKLLETFSTCIRCHNCMNVCPICYCKECVFKSSVFEHRSDQFLNWSDRKGAVRMPSDTLIFHLTRLTHMATSCIGCGMCDSACPSKLPVSRLFNLIGKELQEMFEYVPGRNIEEEAPVSGFREEELTTESGTT